DGDAHSALPHALSNIVGTSHTLELKAHTDYEHDTYESFICWRIVPAEGVDENGGSSTVDTLPETGKPVARRLLTQPSVATPSKTAKAKKQKG
ncbi:hypothetical protein Tco_1158789, partial [Tanacetum coccineum]